MAFVRVGEASALAPGAGLCVLVRGVEVGTRVRVQGIDAGEVESVEPPATPGGDVMLRMRLAGELRKLFAVAAALKSAGLAETEAVPVSGRRVPGLPPPQIEGFEVLEYIDGGGQADVWRARQLGLDRVVMLLAGETSIREVIAFAKTTKAQDLMAESPS